MYVALKSFKVPNSSGKTITVHPGQEVPGADGWPNIHRWVGKGFLKWDGEGAPLVSQPAKRVQFTAVDADGNPLSPEQVNRYRAERDVKNLKSTKHLVEEAVRVGVLTTVEGSGGRTLNDLKRELIAAYEREYDVQDRLVLGRTLEVSGVEAAEPPPSDDGEDDEVAYHDDRYDSHVLGTTKKAELLAIANDDFALDLPKTTTVADLRKAIENAGWTEKALSYLSVEKLVEIAKASDIPAGEEDDRASIIKAILAGA